MHPKFCRYTDDQLKILGYNPSLNTCTVKCSTVENQRKIDELVKGKFAMIIDAIFTSKDGKLDNVLGLQVSENAPQAVRSFMQNVLMADVGEIQAAPDDETALNCIIPRHCQTQSEMRPYMDSIKQFIADSRAKYIAEHLPKQNVKPSKTD